MTIRAAAPLERGLCVTDLAASLSFFRDGPGFEISPHLATISPRLAAIWRGIFVVYRNAAASLLA